jgi:hypothetical protein
MLEPGEQVTAATYDPASGTIILLTYSSILRYSKDRFSGFPAARTRIWARQCEATAFCDGDLIITNEERDVFSIPAFLSSSFTVLMPSRASAEIPKRAGSYRLGQDAASWKAFGRDLSLKNAEAGEFTQWLLTEDRVLVRAGFRAEGPIQATDPPYGLGTIAVLMFAPAEAQQSDAMSLATHVVVGVDDQRRLRVWRLALSEEGPVLSEASGFEVVGRVDHRLEFELSIPTAVLFGSTFPPRFLFDLQTMGFRAARDPYYCNQGPFALERPLAWADVRVEG